MKMSVNIAGSECTNWPERWTQRKRHPEAWKNVWRYILYHGRKFWLRHAIAVHNLNHSHSTISYTPSITTQSVHQLYSCSMCLQLHTIFLKHNPNPSI